MKKNLATTGVIAVIVLLIALAIARILADEG